MPIPITPTEQIISSERNTKNSEKPEPSRAVLDWMLDLNLSISEYLNQEYVNKNVKAPEIKSKLFEITYGK